MLQSSRMHTGVEGLKVIFNDGFYEHQSSFFRSAWLLAAGA